MTVQEFSELVSECVFTEIESVESILENAADEIHNFSVQLTSGEKFVIVVKNQ
ncbi:MAG: hypothetical protein PHC84_01985 [Clostridia bacterium]|nr:hypothetical protein [Clostridia bacterium]